VIEVVSEMVHMNSPLTAWEANASNVTLISSPVGLSQSQVTIPPGGSVTWQAAVDEFTTADQLEALMTSPLSRLLSALDPLTDPDGWDSGMLLPGGGYTRLFSRPGTYAYSDGFGHNGKVIVVEEALFKVVLPLVVSQR
jgi:hypothetical protein